MILWDISTRQLPLDAKEGDVYQWKRTGNYYTIRKNFQGKLEFNGGNLIRPSNIDKSNIKAFDAD